VSRIIYGALSLAVVLPPETFKGAIYVNFVGITVSAALLAADWLRLRASKRAPSLN
jgi:hypothetical protein